MTKKVLHAFIESMGNELCRFCFKGETHVIHHPPNLMPHPFNENDPLGVPAYCLDCGLVRPNIIHSEQPTTTQLEQEVLVEQCLLNTVKAANLTAVIAFSEMQKSRAVSLAITKLEESGMWAQRHLDTYHTEQGA